MTTAIPVVCPLAWLNRSRDSLGYTALGELREGTVLLLCSSFSSSLGLAGRP
jgi:hypothetical protein